MEDFGLTQEEVAKELGKSRSYIANTVRLLNLHEKIIEYISKGQLTAGHGKALLSIKDEDKQLHAAEEIIRIISTLDKQRILQIIRLTKKVKRLKKNHI